VEVLGVSAWACLTEVADLFTPFGVLAVAAAGVAGEGLVIFAPVLAASLDLRSRREDCGVEASAVEALDGVPFSCPASLSRVDIDCLVLRV
jgi:hypothetical protein